MIVRVLRILTSVCVMEAMLAMAPAIADNESHGYWIWSADKDSSKGVPAGERRFFRRTFDLKSEATHGEIIARADDRYVLHLNGQRVGAGEDWQRPDRYDVTRLLKIGKNVIAVEAANNLAGPAGLFVTVKIEPAGGKQVQFATDKSWRASADSPRGWTTLDFDDGAWTAAGEWAPQGGGPWGGGTNRLPKPIDELYRENMATYRKSVRRQKSQDRLNLVPQPKELKMEAGSFDLVRGGKAVVKLVGCYIDLQEMFAARLVQAAIEELSGVKVQIDDAAVTHFGPGQLWILRSGCGALPKEARDLAKRARQLPPDAYLVRAPGGGLATSILSVSNRDEGLPMEAHTLVQLMQLHGDTLSLPRCSITDWPDLEWRGVVGGTTLADLPYLSFYKFNAVTYAVGYGEPISPRMAELATYFHRWGIKPVLFWHPAQDFCYSDRDEVKRVCHRIREAGELGFHDFSINVDDFPEETVTEQDQARFGAGKVGLFKAQQSLLLKAREACGDLARLWFCPRVYYNIYRSSYQPTKPSEGEVAYRKRVGDLPKDIVIWTTEPKLDYLRATAQLWKRKPMVWHNYFLDFSQCHERYFEGYPALPPEFLKTVAGLWVEGDQFQGYSRLDYLPPASEAWNAAHPVALSQAMERELGPTAGKAVWEYARLLGADEKASGILADYWSQPDSAPAKLFAAGSDFAARNLKPEEVAALKLEERISLARQAADMDLAGKGVPSDLATELRNDARKIAANLQIFAALTVGDEARKRTFWQGQGKGLIEELAQLGADSSCLNWLRQQAAAAQ